MCIRDREYIIFNTLENKLRKEIEPNDKEIEEEKERIIKNSTKAEDKKKLEDYFKTPTGEKNIKSSIRRKKLVDILIKNAKIKEISAEELKKQSKLQKNPKKSEQKKSEQEEPKHKKSEQKKLEQEKSEKKEPATKETGNK